MFHPLKISFPGKTLRLVTDCLLIQFSDYPIKSVNFVMGNETEAYYSCSAILNGETLVLGGKRHFNQVSFHIVSRISISFLSVQQSGVLWTGTA